MLLVFLSLWFSSIHAFIVPLSSRNAPADVRIHESDWRLDMSKKGGVTLYGSQGSRSPLVNWGAYELKVPLEMAQDLSSNPHPFRQIPCLVDNDSGAIVFESGAILLHLLDKADLGADFTDAEIGSIKSWIVWANASLDPICFLETPDGKVYDTGLKNPNRRIDVIENILSKETFLLGDKFSLADVAVAAYLLYVPQFFRDIDLSRWPNLVRYMRGCASRECYGKAFGEPVQQYLESALENMGNKKDKLFGMF